MVGVSVHAHAKCTKYPCHGIHSSYQNYKDAELQTKVCDYTESSLQGPLRVGREVWDIGYDWCRGSKLRFSRIIGNTVQCCCTCVCTMTDSCCSTVVLVQSVKSGMVICHESSFGQHGHVDCNDRIY